MTVKQDLQKLLKEISKDPKKKAALIARVDEELQRRIKNALGPRDKDDRADPGNTTHTKIIETERANMKKQKILYPLGFLP